MLSRRLARLLAVCASLGAMGATAGCASGLRRFVERPVAWEEHDDEDVPRAPRRSGLGRTRIAVGMLDLLVREVDRTLSIEWRRPADDINARDEVPCSTWFCARNHLGAPLTPAAVAAGPPGATAPVPPLMILAGDEAAAERGIDVADAAGRRYRLEFDPPGHAGLASGAEAVAQRLFWAAGYNTPGAFVVELDDSELTIAADATVLHHGYARQPFTRAAVDEMLARVARTADGKRIRAVAVAIPEGTAIGSFDFTGRRGDDPNDRIPHQHRRSLRASFVLAAWIGAAGMSAADTQDVWVEQDGRHFVRHYFRDFSSAFGAARIVAKGPWQGEEKIFEFSRVMASLVLLGFYRRAWQDDRADWAAAQRDTPAVGWFPGAGWTPRAFRTAFPQPAHVRMTDRDGYWGAKVVTSFTAEQIAAAVSAGGWSATDAARVTAALIARRDAIGARWLRRVTAIEDPTVAENGAALCFRDIAIARGAATTARVRYGVRAGDVADWLPAQGERSCVPLPRHGDDYLVLTIISQVDGRLARAARVHLVWHPAERRYALVGLERNE